MTLLLSGGVIGAGACVMVWMIWLVPERSLLIVALQLSEQKCARLQGTVARDVAAMRELTEMLDDPARGRIPAGPLRLLPRFPVPVGAIEQLISTHPDEVTCAMVRFQYARSSCFSISCDRCNGSPADSTAVTVDAG